MNDAIRRAFDDTSNGYSADRVVADPDLNRAFLDTCSSFGFEGTDAELNRSLLNLRKAGSLSDRKSRSTKFDDTEYRFAAEIAARYSERRHCMTLDGIICDPVLRAELASTAESIAPGFSALQYVWSALAIRKKKELRPELVAQLLRPEEVLRYTTASLDTTRLPTKQGIYLFHTTAEILYVGESENLRKRVEKHLDHSDNRELARWFWSYPTDTVHLELQVLPESTAYKVRRALETELIRSRNPLFNVQR